MQEFVIAPAGARPFWILVPVMVILVGVVILLAVAAIGSRSARFEVSGAGLRIRGDLFGRTVPAHALAAGQARRVDLRNTPALQPRRRTFGTGLPGYRSGWFRLANGETALLYLTDYDRAVYIPTDQGYSLLVSPADPDGFVDAVRRMGNRQGRSAPR
jgi:hypothetical protein